MVIEDIKTQEEPAGTLDSNQKAEKPSQDPVKEQASHK
jgi:hypothetical protein